jgi:hypothetical protein
MKQLKIRHVVAYCRYKDIPCDCGGVHVMLDAEAAADRTAVAK